MKMRNVQDTVISRASKWGAFAAALVLVGGMLPAHAQYTNPYTGNTFNNPASSFLDTVILHNMQTMQLRTSMMVSSNMLTSSLSRSGPKLTKKQQAEADRFARYRGTMFKSGRPVMPVQLAASFIKTPGKQREDMTKLFSVLLEVYNQRSRQQKAPANDLARTLAYCIAANYAYYTEQEVSASGLAMLRGKIRTALTASDKFRKIKDADKQKVSETLIILTHFAALGYDQAKEGKNKESMEMFRKLAGLNLQGMLGVAPGRVKLEKTGLVVTD
jgi:hypothetical protein